MLNLKISIITASYNSDSTIADTIESIYNQTYNNIEYIIVDGASSDKTIDIVKEHEIKFQGKLKWISEKDQGIYDAWNKGLRIATGDWICFLGSDDVLMPNAIKDYTDLICDSEKEINFISSRVDLVNSELEHIMFFGDKWSSKMKHFCCIAHVGSFHKSVLFNKYGFYSTKYKICSDYEFLLRNYHNINPLFMNKVTAKMRNCGISNKNPFPAFNETLYIKNSCKVNSVFINYIFYLRTLLGFYLKKILFNS